MANTPYLSRRALWLNRLSEELVRGLSERMESGVLAAGEALPDREALMAEFVTSAGVVDRAMDGLLAAGLVFRDGEGVLRVSEAARRREALLPAGDARADVIAVVELRIGIEAQAAALAASRRTEAEMDAIRRAHSAFEAAAEAGEGASQADFLFHLAIAEASGNPYIRDLTEHLGPLLIPRMRLSLGSDPESRRANLADARVEHRSIMESIAAADPDAARRAMRGHLSRTLELVRKLDG